MKQRVSIKDIAEVAGVSAPTVSRALQRRGRVSAATREQIIAVAQELGYTPSLVARGLVTQRSYTVGLVVTSFTDPFHSQIAQGVEEEATRHGYSIVLANSGFPELGSAAPTDDTVPGDTAQVANLDHAATLDREVAVVRNLQGHQVDGIIISSSHVGDRYADLLQESGIPLVLVNTLVEGENIHSIYHDDYAGGRLLMDHLLDRGYRRIGYIGDGQGGRANSARRAAWCDALTEAELSEQLAIIDPVGQLAGGVAATEKLLADAEKCWQAPPDALYCYNDVMAIGALSALNRAGLTVPDDIAVTGFDDIDVAAFTIPPLTTLHQPRREMGTAAMRTLITLIEQRIAQDRDNLPPGSNGTQTTKMLGELMIRGSS